CTDDGGPTESSSSSSGLTSRLEPSGRRANNVPTSPPWLTGSSVAWSGPSGIDPTLHRTKMAPSSSAHTRSKTRRAAIRPHVSTAPLTTATAPGGLSRSQSLRDDRCLPTDPQHVVPRHDKLGRILHRLGSWGFPGCIGAAIGFYLADRGT